MTATFYVGDAIEVMNRLPEKSVDLILTSPPFLALRSYLPSDHPDKALEGGSQATPGEFVDWLIDVVEACARVLAPHGSLCIELGDTYSGSGGAGGDYAENGLREGQPKFRQAGARGGGAGHMEHRKQDDQFYTLQPGGRGRPLAKSLSLIPELFRLTLVYGTNPLTGRQTERWRLRNVVRWVRPNPPVGALGDKFRPATSELMVFCKSAKRYFDLDSVRSSPPDSPRATGGAPFGVATLGPELGGTLRTDDGSSNAGWWCDIREAEITVKLPVTRLAENFEVVELVGLKIRVEQAERSYVVDLQACRGPAASPTDIAVAVERFLPGTFPIGSTVTDPPTTPCGIVLTSPIGGTPSAIAFETAEVLMVEGRFIAPNRLAARITLNVNGTFCDALLIAPITASDHRLDFTRHRPAPPKVNRDKVMYTSPDRHDGQPGQERYTSGHPAGAPPLDWWNIPPGGYEGAHYAVFPPELCVKPIKAMCPEKVCRTCGEPSRRIVGESVPVDQSDRFDRQPALAAHIRERREAKGLTFNDLNGWFGFKAIASHWEVPGLEQGRIPNPDVWPVLKERLGLSDDFDDLIYGERKWGDSVVESTVVYKHVSDYPSGNTQDATGRVYQRLASRKDRIPPDRFSDCGHDDWRPGLVLDPFGGSGTTALVATGHGRDAILIDLDERNFDLALERVGPFILERAS